MGLVIFYLFHLLKIEGYRSQRPPLTICKSSLTIFSKLLNSNLSIN